MRFEMPRDWRGRAGLLFLAGVVVFGGIGCGMLFGQGVTDWVRGGGGLYFGAARPRPRAPGIPVSKLPGPPRTSDLTFVLDAGNARLMQGLDDRKNERWCDILGNYYTREFVQRFSYADTGPAGPKVWIKVEPQGLALSGRLEARGLKPNFAYQLKLFGDFAADRPGFELIGKAGRWRLPGRATNYSDDDYADCPAAEKPLVEAYILFDYFVTDAHGDAGRNFYLDSSLHVLWQTTQYSYGVPTDDLVRVTVNASDPAVYARPKTELQTVGLWSERESSRYQAGNQIIRLPPRAYQAALVLTEESFHSHDNDGGWWATVLRLPVTFEVRE
jgi:hypothetical protein